MVFQFISVVVVNILKLITRPKHTIDNYNLIYKDMLQSVVLN